jgi:hypothetical protein
VVFTVPSELNPLIYANQSLLYALLHKCASETLLELSSDRKYLGAVPSILQILHTWGQTLNFHPHIHCIVSGGGLTKEKQFKRSSHKFFIPVRVLGKKFRGKFLAMLEQYYQKGLLTFSDSCKRLKNSYQWQEFRNSLYCKNWIPYIKETFNGFGNAIDYLGRYTHRIAISNTRITEVSEKSVSFWAKDYKTGERKVITVSPKEFIRRFLMHVLPSGFQKIRYYGFLNNRYKKVNLKLIAKLTGKELFQSTYAQMSTFELLQTMFGLNVHQCPKCGCEHFSHSWRTYYQLD